MPDTKSAIDREDTPAIGLLLVVLWTVFIVPVFPVHVHRLLYASSLTAIFLIAVTAMERHRKTILLMALATTITEWIAIQFQMLILVALSHGTNIVFFWVVVISLIAQVATTKRVTAKVILQAVNGYLLLGIIFAATIAFVMLYDPGAYKFPGGDPATSDYLYFAFVTMTTLGYGDVVPTVAYAKSLAILAAISGQIYVAVIIATLVGKLAGRPSSNSA